MNSAFPVFDIYSTPLLILLIQGLIFSALISWRFVNTKYLPYGLLAILIFLLCFERIHYTIGFMSWYDSFPNTKINYYLIPVSLAIGPLIFIYIKSITNGGFRLKRKYAIHFVPFLVFTFYRIGILIFDSTQVGFQETQNGLLMTNLEIPIINPLMIIISAFHLVLYFAFTIQMFWFYRLKIKRYYSNTYTLELNWVVIFISVFLFLLLYDLFQNFIDSFIIELHWTQKWWFHFLSSIAIVYFGIKGYFTKIEKLQDINFSFEPFGTLKTSNQVSITYKKEVEKLDVFMIAQKPYLNPELNLSELSSLLKINPAFLSEIINSGKGKNFNDFINHFRVQEFKNQISANKHKELTLLAIANDSGFNSKATFNRVFKKLEGCSPSEYISNNQE